MTTHELARVLSSLAGALRRAPNQPIDDFFDSRPPRRRSLDPTSIPVALSTLVALSAFDKAEWLRLIDDYEFPVEVRARDSSRDILTKLLKFLEENPDARQHLARSSTRDRSAASPELARALRLLLDS